MMTAYLGYVRDTVDALAVFEACRQGLLEYTHIRLTAQGRKDIRSGSIFVWEQNLSGIKRWTDGRNWSASRYVDHFLIYRELKHKQFGTEQDFLEGGLSKRSISISSVDGKKFHLINYYREEDIHKMTYPSNDPNLNFVLPKHYYLFENDFISPEWGNQTWKEPPSSKQTEGPMTFIHHTPKDSYTNQNSNKNSKVSSDPFPTNVTESGQALQPTRKLSQRLSFYDQTSTKLTSQPNFIPNNSLENRPVYPINERMFELQPPLKNTALNFNINLHNLDDEVNRNSNNETAGNKDNNNNNDDGNFVKRTITYSSEDKRLLDLLHSHIKM